MKIIEKKVNFLSVGHKLFGLLQIPDNSNNNLIILFHGLTNSMIDCPLIEQAAKTFLHNSFPVFRFDYFGSGKSPGNFIDKTIKILVKNTNDGIDFVINQLKYKKIGVWGRSVGAVLGSTVCDRKEIFSSVFISTTTHTHQSFSKLFQKNKQYSTPIIGTGKIKGEPILPGVFYQQTSWLDSLQKKHLSNSKNILIIPGTEDKTVYDLNWTKSVYKIIQSPKKLEIIKGANHAYQGCEEKVISKALKWFAKYSNNTQRNPKMMSPRNFNWNLSY